MFGDVCLRFEIVLERLWVYVVINLVVLLGVDFVIIVVVLFIGLLGG